MPAGDLPSMIDAPFGSIFQTSQCVNNPLGASGSSTTNTNAFASGGTPAICKGGLVSVPSQVNFEGMLPPSVNALLVTLIAPPSAAKTEQATTKTANEDHFIW